MEVLLANDFRVLFCKIQIRTPVNFYILVRVLKLWESRTCLQTNKAKHLLYKAVMWIFMLALREGKQGKIGGLFCCNFWRRRCAPFTTTAKEKGHWFSFSVVISFISSALILKCTFQDISQQARQLDTEEIKQCNECWIENDSGKDFSLTNLRS